MSSALSSKGRWSTCALFCAILLLATVIRVGAFSLFATVHLDEVLQYQERAFRLVFDRGLVPWESRHGLRNALIPDLLAGPMWLVSRFTSDFWAPLIGARAVFAGICLIAVPAAYWIGSLRSRAHGLVAMFVAAVWYESVVFGVQVLSESIATAFACAGTASVMRARDSRNAALFAGFALTMTALLRLQYSGFVGVLTIMTLGLDFTAWRRLIAGALPALALGAATDIAAGQLPFAWALANFGINVVEGRADTFGVSPPLAYVQALLLQLHLFSIPILVGAALTCARYRPLLIAALANIFFHSLIGHKEYRFIWLSVFVLIILAAITSVDLVQRVLRSRVPDASRRERAWPPLLAVLCLVWAGLSLATYRANGGITALRDSGVLTELVVDAARIPGSCAVGVPIEDRRASAYVFVPRPLELYLIPNTMKHGTEPFDRTITDAVDALVLTGKGVPPSYRKIICRMDNRTRGCLYWREGGCNNRAAASRYLYQNMLINNDQ